MYPRLSPVVKNLLIINGLVFLASMVLPYQGMQGGLNYLLGLYYPGSNLDILKAKLPYPTGGFQPFQIVTHMFIHWGFGHLFMNMFGLWMFGNVLEMRWGSEKFLKYYLATGLGAAVLYTAVNALVIYMGSNTLTPGVSELVGAGQSAQGAYFSVAGGASGAIFGLVLGFAMLYPDVPITLLFLPIPIKAKYFAMGYAAIELVQGLQMTGNVAHFAHLGGMLFGYLLIRYWESRY